MDIKDRVKEVRKAFGLTQQQMADRLQMAKPSISAIEYGTSGMSERTVTNICREFNVNESWLRTGEGEMLAPMSREQEIASITASIIKENNPIRIQLEKIVCNLTDEQLEHIYQMAKELVEAVENEKDIPD